MMKFPNQSRRQNILRPEAQIKLSPSLSFYQKLDEMFVCFPQLRLKYVEKLVASLCHPLDGTAPISQMMNELLDKCAENSEKYLKYH